MKKPRLMVRNWFDSTAVEWKCSCDRWSMELPDGPLKPQEKAAIVAQAFARHLQEMHALLPLPTVGERGFDVQR